jgi:hypothetical protein
MLKKSLRLSICKMKISASVGGVQGLSKETSMAKFPLRMWNLDMVAEKSPPSKDSTWKFQQGRKWP